MWNLIRWYVTTAVWVSLIRFGWSTDAPQDQRVVYLLGRTGDGKSSLGNAMAMEMGVVEQSVFSEGDSPTSHTAAPQAVANDRIRIVDTPGLMDNEGSTHDEANMVEIVKHAQQMGYVHGFLLVINEQSPRFDSGMQDAVRLLVDTFGATMMNHLGVVFTRSTLRTSEETLAWMQSFRELLSARLERPVPHHIPHWRVDSKPEQLLWRGVSEDEVARRHMLNKVAIHDVRQWLWTRDRLDVTQVLADEYEVTKRHKALQEEVARLQTEAEEARRRAHELAVEAERTKSAEVQREAARWQQHARDMNQRVENARTSSSYWEALAIGMGIAIIAM